MRRDDREIRDRKAIRALMQEALVCRIGLADGLAPYVVPMNFGLGENCLYLHCATEGRKLEILRKNDRVCFEMDLLRDIKQAPEACGWSARYDSVIGFGRAVVLADADQKRLGLDRIMDHYGARGPFRYSEEVLARTAVIRIDITEISGKRRE